LRTEFSYQELEMYLRCSKYYWFYVVKGIRKPPHIMAVEASCHNYAMKRCLIENLDYETHLEIFMDRFNKIRHFIGSKHLTRNHHRKSEHTIKEAAIASIGGFHCRTKNLFPVPLPFREGEERVFEWDKYKVNFKIDLWAGKVPVILDFRWETHTSRNRYKLLNLLVSHSTKSKYFMVDLNLMKLVKFINCYLYDIAKGKIRVTNLVRDCIHSINSGHFVRCNPKNWFCTNEFCEFYHICNRILER